MIAAVAAIIAAIGGFVAWFVAGEARKRARLDVTYHKPPHGPGRIIIHNHGPAVASRVVVKLDGRWLRAEGGFSHSRPTGFSRVAPDTSVELILLPEQVGEPGPQALELAWRDDSNTKRLFRTEITTSPVPVD